MYSAQGVFQMDQVIGRLRKQANNMPATRCGAGACRDALMDARSGNLFIDTYGTV